MSAVISSEYRFAGLNKSHGLGWAHSWFCLLLPSALALRWEESRWWQPWPRKPGTRWAMNPSGQPSKDLIWRKWGMRRGDSRKSVRAKAAGRPLLVPPHLHPTPPYSYPPVVLDAKERELMVRLSSRRLQGPGSDGWRECPGKQDSLLRCEHFCWTSGSPRSVAPSTEGSVRMRGVGWWCGHPVFSRGDQDQQSHKVLRQRGQRDGRRKTGRKGACTT